MTQGGSAEDTRVLIAPPPTIGDSKSRRTGYLALIASGLITATAFAGIADLARVTMRTADSGQEIQEFEREPSIAPPGAELVPGQANPGQDSIEVSGAASADGLPTTTTTMVSPEVTTPTTVVTTHPDGTTTTTVILPPDSTHRPPDSSSKPPDSTTTPPSDTTTPDEEPPPPTTTTTTTEEEEPPPPGGESSTTTTTEEPPTTTTTTEP